jgi:hypothetical protein
MITLAQYREWTIERNPAGLIIASKGKRSFPFIANSVEHAQAVIDQREGDL